MSEPLAPVGVKVVTAWIALLPATVELIATVQMPDVVEQVLTPPTNVAEPLTMENVTTVPSGTFAVPPPEVTVAVIVCAVPIELVALPGVITMAASTYFFAASELLPCVPSVARVSAWAEPVGVKVVTAWIVLSPAAVEVITTVQRPDVVLQVLVPPTNVAEPLAIEKVTTVPFGA